MADKNKVTKRLDVNRPLTFIEGDQNLQEIKNVIDDQQGFEAAQETVNSNLQTQVGTAQSDIDNHKSAGNPHNQYALTSELEGTLADGAGALRVRGAVIYVDTIADLQALPTAGLVDGQQVSVTETGRAGDFVIKAGSPPISDPQQGVYVVLDNDNYAQRIKFNSVMLEFYGVSSNDDAYQAILSARDFCRSSSIKRIDTRLSDLRLSNTVYFNSPEDDGLNFLRDSPPVSFVRYGTSDVINSCFQSTAKDIYFGRLDLSRDAEFTDYRAGIEFRGGSALVDYIGSTNAGLGAIYVKEAPEDFTLHVKKLFQQYGDGRLFAQDAPNVRPGAVRIESIIAYEGGADIFDCSSGSISVGQMICDRCHSRAFKKGGQSAGGTIEIESFKYTNAYFTKVLSLSGPSGLFDLDEIITGSTSGATATLASRKGVDRDILNVRDVTGAFSQGESITGSQSGSTATLEAIADRTGYEVMGQTTQAVDLIHIGSAFIDSRNGPAIDFPSGGNLRIGRLEISGGGPTNNGTVRLDGFVGSIGEYIAYGTNEGPRSFLLQGASSDILIQKVNIQSIGVEGFRSFGGRMCFENVYIDGVGSRGIVWDSGEAPYLMKGVIKNISGGNRPWEVTANATNAMIAHIRFTGSPTNQADTVQTDTATI